MDKLTKEQRRKNMQAVKSKDSQLELTLGKALWKRGLRYRKNDGTVFGKPDFTFKKLKIAIFCDSEFWHGKDWDVRKHDHKSRQDFWYPKIERNIQRDTEVNKELNRQGWKVLRFWGEDIKKNLSLCVSEIEDMIKQEKTVSTKRISFETIKGVRFKIKLIEPNSDKEAILTHYLHNSEQGVSSSYPKEVVECARAVLQYKFPEEEVSLMVAEEALQYGIFNTSNIPFPPVEHPQFTFIDLFAGIGGFRLAMQRLEGKCVYTSEWDPEAKKTYRANFGEVPFGDITKEETKSHIPDNFDLLCAGFPCQAFSIAGKRGGFEDIRGTLFFDVAEIIRRKQPRAIFLENVKGLQNHDKGKTLKTILNVLRKELNYFVPDPQVINAKNFGVPQNRERIYIIAFHKDTGVTDFNYPEPMGKKVCFADVKERKIVPTKYYLSTRYLQTLREHKNRHESKGNGFGYEIILDDAVSNAIVVGGMGRERNLVIDNRITDFTPTTKIKGEVNREGIRKMTPREWARLQGFPDNFVIPVADASAYKQFGNSVAVPAIQATAQKILNKIKPMI
jgi:DNA (cytosine-5)-methyltransferase 1